MKEVAIYVLVDQILAELRTGEFKPSWSARASMPIARQNHAAAPLSGDRVLVMGGNPSPADSSVERYDSVTDTWTTRANLPRPRSRLAAAPLGGDRVLAVGGYDYTSPGLNYVDRYDDATNTWTTRANLPAPRYWLAAAPLSGGRVLAMGGISSGSTYANVYRYDDASNTWTERASMPYSRHSLAAVPLSGDRVLAMGGTTGSSPTTEYAHVMRYDDAANSWTTRASMPTAKYRHSAAPLSGDRVMVIAGRTGGGDAGNDVNTVEIYSDATNKWTSTAGLNTPRNTSAAAPLSGDRVLVTGGWGPGGYLSSVELYTPVSVSVTRKLRAIQALAFLPE